MDSENEEWRRIGQRVLAARQATRLSQAELAASIDVDRSVISRIETAERRISAVELVRIARALKRTVDWFLSPPPRSIIARRDGRDVEESPSDYVLETLVRDVELIRGMVTVPPSTFRNKVTVETVDDAEHMALGVRQHLHLGDSPIVDLIDVSDKLGMFAFVLELSDPKLDGSYVSYARWRCGVDQR